MSKELQLSEIQNRIFTITNSQVIIDSDLVEMYQVETKVFNQAVKRNKERFPEAFKFQLNSEEKNELVTNCDRFVNLKHSSSEGNSNNSNKLKRLYERRMGN